MIVEPGLLIAPLIAFFIAAASPGPATLAVAATSMAHGRRAGILLGIGLAGGVIFWGMLTALGLGALILTWAPALIVLKLAGGAYLLYLAWMSARSALQNRDDTALSGHSITGRNLIQRGFVLNLMNPKAVLAWAAVIALGLPKEESAGYLTAILGVCALMIIGIYAGYACLFSAPPVRAAYARGRRWCEAAFALGFSVAGLRLMFWRTAPA